MPMSTSHKLNFIQILKFKQGTYYLDQPTFLQKVQINLLGNYLSGKISIPNSIQN